MSRRAIENIALAMASPANMVTFPMVGYRLTWLLRSLCTGEGFEKAVASWCLMVCMYEASESQSGATLVLHLPLPRTVCSYLAAEQRSVVMRVVTHCENAAQYAIRCTTVYTHM